MGRVVVTVGVVGVMATGGLFALRGAFSNGQGELLRRVSVRERVVALSFDDGPDPRWTPRVLSLLGRYQASATFFVTGRNADAHPALIEREVALGEEVANHTYSHPYLVRLPAAAVQTEIERATEAIQRAGAPRPTLFRPPYGMLDATIVNTVRRNRLQLVLWSITVERYLDQGTIKTEVARILSAIRPGSIILAHDGGVPDRSRTLTALPILLQGLRERGYQTISVGQLLALHH